MLELFQISPMIFIASVFILSLLIGSFLNVVIYRLPIMMEQEWRTHFKELEAIPATITPQGHFNLIIPQSRCPFCGAQITVLKLSLIHI